MEMRFSFSPLARKSQIKWKKRKKGREGCEAGGGGGEAANIYIFFRTTAASGVLNDCLAPLKPDVLIKSKCPDQYVSSPAFLK